MSAVIAFVVLMVTVIPAIIIGLVLAPFGLADDWGKGYENWLTDTVCNCRAESIKGESK